MTGPPPTLVALGLCGLPLLWLSDLLACWRRQSPMGRVALVAAVVTVAALLVPAT